MKTIQKQSNIQFLSEMAETVHASIYTSALKRHQKNYSGIYCQKCLNKSIAETINNVSYILWNSHLCLDFYCYYLLSCLIAKFFIAFTMEFIVLPIWCIIQDNIKWPSIVCYSVCDLIKEKYNKKNMLNIFILNQFFYNRKII